MSSTEEAGVISSVSLSFFYIIKYCLAVTCSEY